MLFTEFEWDGGNIDHIIEHNVAPDEVEEACANGPHLRRTAEGRYLVYGTTDGGRHLFIVGIYKGRGVFRTITARDMTGREKSFYRREAGK